MTVLDVNLVDEPLDIDSFSYLSDADYPYCLIGFQLKNLYDQKRLKINEKYSPKEIIHLIPGETVMPKFFRGIKININPKFNYLLTKLESLGTHLSEKVDKDFYVETLNEYNLSCNNCFAYLRKGVYPIDSEHLEYFTDSKITQEELYSKVLDCTGLNKFQSLGYFVIYVLSNKNIYKNTTNNFLHAVVKKYTNP